MSLAARVSALATRVATELRIIGEQTILTDSAAFTRAAGVAWLGGARLMRSRRAITLDLSVQEFNGWAGESMYLVGTLPAGYWPAIGTVGAAAFYNGGSTYTPTVATVGTDGKVYVHLGVSPRYVGLRISLEYVRA